MSTYEFISHSPLDTEALGKKLGALLPPGSFVALKGGLGSGKTCFARGIIAAVAPQSAHLAASPTYAIMNCYPGGIPVYHFDFYRLSGDNDVSELGFEDYFHGEGVCIVEWSERLTELLPDNYLTVTFNWCEDDRREIVISACGTSSQQIVALLAKQGRIQNFL